MEMYDFCDNLGAHVSEEDRTRKYKWAQQNLKLVATTDGNWDYYANETPDGVSIYSVAKPGSGSGNSYFGRVEHIKRLFNEGRLKGNLTTYGKKLLQQP